MSTSGIHSVRGASRTSVLVALTAATVGLIYGYDLGAISGALLFLKNDFGGLSSFEQSAVTAVVVIGQIVGALVAWKVANRFGRKNAMVAVAIGFAVFAVLSAVAPDKYFLAGARFFLGVAIGVSIISAPAFVAEMAPAQVRGALLVAFQIATTSGIAIAYFVDVALAGTKSWRLMLGVSAVAAVVVLAFIVRLKDTPRWYVMRGRREEALQVLRDADPDADADAELSEIEAALADEDRAGSFRELITSRYGKAAVFVIVLGFLVQITGINGIVYYSPTIFQGVGVKGDTGPILIGGVVQVAGVAAELLSFVLVDRWGRRPTLLSGIGTMVLANVLLMIAFSGSDKPALAFIGILLFTMGFNFGFGSLVWIYASESFPARLRTVGASAMLTADLIANFIVGVLFLNVFGSLGGVGTFAIFLGLALVSAAFVWWLAPETKGRELEEIRHYWENGAKWPESRSRAADNIRGEGSRAPT